MTTNNPEAAAAAMIEADPLTGCPDELMSTIAGLFRRREPRNQAKKYIQALMSDLPRKDCWTSAEHTCDAAPHRMQHLLARAKWDTTAGPSDAGDGRRL